MIIPLGRQLPDASSDLPENLGRAALERSPIRSCSGWGLPCLPCHQRSGELLPRLFTLTRHGAALRNAGGIFSVALSLGSPPVAVSDHPALWSSDFPLIREDQRPSAPLQPPPFTACCAGSHPGLAGTDATGVSLVAGVHGLIRSPGRRHGEGERGRVHRRVHRPCGAWRHRRDGRP